METLKHPACMHRRLGSATLSQLAFPRESNPNFPWEKSHWDNTAVKSNSNLFRTPDKCAMIGRCFLLVFLQTFQLFRALSGPFSEPSPRAMYGQMSCNVRLYIAAKASQSGNPFRVSSDVMCIEWCKQGVVSLRPLAVYSIGQSYLTGIAES